MKVEPGKVITLDYIITTEKGELIESSAGRGDPLVFVHGQGGLLPGVDGRLQDMVEGEEKEFVLQPEEAFGTTDSGPTMVINKQFLPDNAQTAVGSMFQGEVPGTNQTVNFVVMEDRASEVMVRLIHPLAGKTIHVKATIIKIEEPSG